MKNNTTSNKATKVTETKVIIFIAIVIGAIAGGMASHILQIPSAITIDEEGGIPLPEKKQDTSTIRLDEGADTNADNDACDNGTVRNTPIEKSAKGSEIKTAAKKFSPEESKKAVSNKTSELVHKTDWIGDGDPDVDWYYNHGLISKKQYEEAVNLKKIGPDGGIIIAENEDGEAIEEMPDDEGIGDPIEAPEFISNEDPDDPEDYPEDISDDEGEWYDMRITDDGETRVICYPAAVTGGAIVSD